MKNTNASCKICGISSSGWSKAAHSTFAAADLAGSANAGCLFCGLIVKATSLWSAPQESRAIKLERKSTSPYAKEDHYWRCLLSREGTKTSYFRSGATVTKPATEDEYKIEIFIADGQECFQNLARFKDIPSSARSQETWRFIKQRLEFCEQNHEVCRAASQSVAALPKRLLRLEGSRARVVDVASDFTDRFVALSYCWGKQEDHASTLKTTRQTIQRLQEEVSAVELAPTLRDAIEVTAYLGISHIWIDALCILQGDADDWVEESVKMADIYGGAYVVLHAASCSSVMDSFLDHARDSISLDHDLNIKARRVNAFGHHGEAGYRVDDPIDRRAWTLQEKAMSTRAIRYSTTEVQWNCLEDRSCECGKDPVDDAQYLYSYPALLRRFPGEPTKAWGVLIEDYSNRSITNPDDIFPAISALARRMAVDIKSQYVAGLWMESDPVCLLWQLRQGPEPFPSKYVAPSFSWASTRRQAVIPSSLTFDRMHATILSREHSLGSSDPFGSLTAASLEIRGMLMPALLDLYGREEQLCLQGTGGSSCLFEMDGPIVQFQAGPGVSSVRRAGPTGNVNLEIKEAPVCFWPVGSKESGPYCEVYGLILGRSPLCDGYERLGFARKWASEDDIRWPEETTFRLL